MNEFNVISLFDGMSCAMITLDRLGIKPDNYFASEIDKYAMQVSKANWPQIKHIGDVTKINYFEGVLYTEFGKYEVSFANGLICGGSPCQGFSFAGKQLNFEDPRSKLFFEFVRIYEEIKAEHPDLKVFLENVVMKKEYQAVISEKLGLQPVLINSALVSAQNRKRLYWTNIPFQGQPTDRGILLKHILEYEVDSKYGLSAAGLERGLTKKYSSPKFDPDKTGTLNTKNNSGQLSIDSGTTFVSVEQDDKSLTLTAGYRFNPSDKEYLVDRKKQKIKLSQNEINYMNREVSDGRTHWDFHHHHDSDNPKSSAITANISKGVPYNVLIDRTIFQLNPSKESGRKQPFMQNRIYDIEGKGVALTATKSDQFKVGYLTPKVVLNIYGGKSQNGNVYDVEGKSKTLSAGEGINGRGIGSSNSPKISSDLGITYRKLTVTECERLQNVPDGYTSVVSNTQGYKMLGNGWNVDTIVHLFEPLLWLDII